MLDIQVVINQMIVLFLALVVGFVANKTHVLTAEGTKMLSKLVVNVAQTALIIAAVLTMETRLSTQDFFTLILASLGMYAVLGIVAIFLPYILRSKRSDYGLYRFMMMFGNVGFMGYPVIGAIFGSDAIFYSAIFNLPFYVLVYSIGIMFVSEGSGKKAFQPKALINAPLIAGIISVIIYALNIKFPAPITETFDMLGNMTTPGAMLILGSSLASHSLKRVFTEWRIYPLAILRLLIMPIAIWALFRNFIASPIILGITVITTGMPAATNATLLCMEYGGNEELASNCVVITTILSVATIPLLSYLLL